MSGAIIRSRSVWSDGGPGAVRARKRCWVRAGPGGPGSDSISDHARACAQEGELKSPQLPDHPDHTVLAEEISPDRSRTTPGPLPDHAAGEPGPIWRESSWRLP